MKIVCIIPARYSSTRLPGKPLLDVAGKPLVVRVYEQVKKAAILSDVIVAVDDERVRAVVEKHGGKAVMTSKNHATGTDRLAEVVRHYPDVDVIINVQGDEPLVEPEVLDLLGKQFVEDEDLQMATVKTPLKTEEVENPNNVKVVTDKNGYALYFSRYPLPYRRNQTGLILYKHIGIYAYRREFLLNYAQMAPTPLEEAESLEQLRALENGYKIKVLETDAEMVGVDTPEDLVLVNTILRRANDEKH